MITWGTLPCLGPAWQPIALLRLLTRPQLLALSAVIAVSASSAHRGPPGHAYSSHRQARSCPA